AILDCRVVADRLAETGDPVAAFRAYEDERLEAVNAIVLTNRSTPPDHLIEVVNQRTGGKPFSSLEEVISPDELRDLFHSYKRVTGYDAAALNAAPTRTAM